MWHVWDLTHAFDQISQCIKSNATKYILQFTNLYTNYLNSKDIEIDLVVTNEMPALVYSTSFFMQF